MRELIDLASLRLCACADTDAMQCAKMRYDGSDDDEPCECVCHQQQEDDGFTPTQRFLLSDCTCEETAKNWKVHRWSGRAPHVMRLVYEGTAEKARSKFKKLADNLRQGEVRLVYPSGTVESVFAPRLRTRW